MCKKLEKNAAGAVFCSFIAIALIWVIGGWATKKEWDHPERLKSVQWNTNTMKVERILPVLGSTNIREFFIRGTNGQRLRMFSTETIESNDTVRFGRVPDAYCYDIMEPAQAQYFIIKVNE